MPARAVTRPLIGPAQKKETRLRKKSPREIDAAAMRARHDSQLYNLTLDVHNLRQELHDLAMRRALLQTRSFYTRADSPVSILRVVGRYFHGIANGYRGVAHHPEQYAFVQSIAAENLSLGLTGLGVDALMDQWVRYTDFFHVRENVLLSTEIITSTDGVRAGGTVVKCLMEARGLLTRRGVEAVFPSASRDPQLLLAALGRPLRIPMLFHLYFNDAGLLVRHDAEGDFFAALCNVLGGDASAAARFLEGARLGQESMVLVETLQETMGDCESGPREEESSWIAWVERIDDDDEVAMETPPSPVFHHIEDDETDDASVVEDDEEIAVAENEPPRRRERRSLAFLLSLLTL